MDRRSMMGLLGVAMIAGCGGGTAGPGAPPATASATNASGTATGSTATAQTSGAEAAQTDAVFVVDAVRKTDEAFGPIGLAPFRFDPGQGGQVIVGGRMQRTALGEQALQDESVLSKAHEGIGSLWGARNKIIRLEFAGERVVDSRPDAAKSAAEKAYLEFLDTSSSRLAVLYEKYWTKMNASTAAAEIDGAFPKLATIRTVARDLLLIGAEHGLRSPDAWRDRSKLSWIRAQDAALVKAARARVESALPEALQEAKTAAPELAEAIKLEAEYDRLFKAAATELRKRIDAGEPIPKELSDVASSLAQAGELARRLKADPKAPPEKRKTLANIDDKLPLMRRAFCAARGAYVGQHGLDSFQKASTMLCKTSAPELLYRNQPVVMEAACLEVYRTVCP